MAPSYTLIEAKSFQQATHCGERNVSVRVSPENLFENLIETRHEVMSLIQHLVVDGRRNKKGRKRDVRMRPLNLILAATYVPAQLPAQYHRLSKA